MMLLRLVVRRLYRRMSTSPKRSRTYIYPDYGFWSARHFSGIRDLASDVRL